MNSPFAFMELFVVLAFLVAWGILELVARRLDGRRERANDTPASAPEAETREAGSTSPEDSGDQQY
jgi:flagellar biosynthesis/type III secretory pathway M-ring protein FliF/YscJ